MATEVNAHLQAVINEVDGVANSGTIQNEKPLITGSADPFSTIDVYDGTTLLGVVSANGQGGWSLQLSTPLFNGVHDFSVVQVTEYGVRGTSSYFAVTVDALEAEQTTQDYEVESAAASAAFARDAQNKLPFFPPNPFTTRAASIAANVSNAHRDKSVGAGPQADQQP